MIRVVDMTEKAHAMRITPKSRSTSVARGVHRGARSECTEARSPAWHELSRGLMRCCTLRCAAFLRTAPCRA